MFGKGKKEKDIQKMLDGLTLEEKSDLFESLKALQEVKTDAKTDENNEQKGNETDKNSTDGANPEVANVNDEKVNEGATTSNDTNPATDDEAQQPNALSVDDVMLKSDFEKYLEQFENRFKGLEEKNATLENQNKDLTDKNKALEDENAKLKEKYENGSFGQYGNKANDDKNNSTTKETFDTYKNKFTF